MRVSKGQRERKLISEPWFCEASNKWYFEGEYHTEAFDTWAAARAAAEAYDDAVARRSEPR